MLSHRRLPHDGKHSSAPGDNQAGSQPARCCDSATLDDIWATSGDHGKQKAQNLDNHGEQPRPHHHRRKCGKKIPGA